MLGVFALMGVLVAAPAILTDPSYGETAQLPAVVGWCMAILALQWGLGRLVRRARRG